MSNSKDYECAVTPTDSMRAYATEGEQFKGAQVDYFAIVVHNDKGQKLSVLLDSASAEDLHAQLENFCFGGSE